MNLLPVLKALPTVMELAGQLVGAAKSARAQVLPPSEELANLEKLAEKQAILVQELVSRVEELAEEVQAHKDRLDVLNRRSSVVLGIALGAASLAITAAVYLFVRG